MTVRPMVHDALVLAGGAARRLDGADKPGLRLGGRTLLDRVISACPGAASVVVVGPERPTERAGVRWCREDPPGGGPVAAVAAGLAEVTAGVVLLLAADLPFLDAAAVGRLLDGLGAAGEQPETVDGAVLVDAGGRDQLLAGAYRTAALRAALAELGPPDGLPLRRLLAPLRLRRLPDPEAAALDCDTWDDLARAELRLTLPH